MHLDRASVFIIFCLQDPRLLVSRVFANPILVFIGKISYGLYLYHNIVPWLWESLLQKLAGAGIVTYHFSRGALVIQELAALILLSWLSFVIIERRFNNLKKYFSYSEKQVSPQAASLAKASDKEEVLA